MKNGAKRPAPAESRKARPFLNRSEGPAFFPAPGVGKASFFPPLQRKEAAAGPAGDDHDLQSRLLAGDAVLEACYDGDKAAYLRTGRSGDAVARVQQALEDLGYPLPKYGVDGIFGAETRGAVRQFQKAHALQVDGVVGPQTIGRLDHLHADAFNPAPEPAPEEPAPEDPGACPDTCEVEPLNLTGFPIQRTPAGPAPPAIQAKHVSMEEAMANFTEKVNPEGEGELKVTEEGQYFWSEVIRAEIYKRILTTDPGADKPGSSFSDLRKAVKEAIIKAKGENLKELKRIVKKPGKMSDMTLEDLWADFIANDKKPSEVLPERLINIHEYNRIAGLEGDACGLTANKVIARFMKQSKKIDPERKRSPDNKIPISKLYNEDEGGGATRHYDVIYPNKTLGDLVNYRNDLSAIIKKMKDALDDNYLIHARVMSGVCKGLGVSNDLKENWNKKKPRPISLTINKEDHSIVIIGYDGDDFAFWNASGGFGELYYRDGRLTTAPSFFYLYVDKDWGHQIEDGRFRYQVLTIWTV